MADETIELRDLIASLLNDPNTGVYGLDGAGNLKKIPPGYISALRTDLNDAVADLADEVTTRSQADAALGTQISNESTARSQADAALGAQINGEVTARQQADTALGTQISNEVTARQQADTALGTQISSEVTARQQADTALGTQISNEVTARQQADTALGTQISNEVTARSQADAALSGRLDPIELHIRPLNTLDGDEFKMREVTNESGLAFALRDENGRVLGGFAKDAAILIRLVRLMNGSSLSPVETEGGFVFPIRDRNGGVIGGQVVDAWVNRAFRLWSGGGISPLHDEAGFQVAIRSPLDNSLAAGVRHDGGFQVDRLVLDTNLPAETGAGSIAVRDALGAVQPLLDVTNWIAAPVHGTGVYEELINGTRLPLLPSRDLCCSGDSMTQGYGLSDIIPWPSVVAQVLADAGDFRSVVNYGAGAHDSSQISARLGGTPIYVTVQGNVITRGQDVAVTAITPRIITNTFQAAQPCTLAGVRGMLYGTALLGDGTVPLAFSPDGGGTGTVSCPPNTRLILDPLPYDTWTHVIRSGRNTPGFDIGIVRTDIMAQVARMRVANRRFLVLAVSNAGTLPPGGGPSTGRSPEGVGTANYDAIVKLNEELAYLFGDRFIDTRRYLIDKGMDEAIRLGLKATTTSSAITAPTAGDLEDIANDIVPRSFRYDELHENNIPHALIGRQVAYRLLNLGW